MTNDEMVKRADAIWRLIDTADFPHQERVRTLAWLLDNEIVRTGYPKADVRKFFNKCLDFMEDFRLPPEGAN